MNTSIMHLPPASRRRLEEMSAIIACAIRPEKIILIGLCATTGMDQSFGEDRLSGFGGFDLLVLTRSGERRSEHEAQDLIINRCRPLGSVTVYLHDIDYVNEELNKGSDFFTHVREEGILLFDAGQTPLVRGTTPDPERILRLAEKDFGLWWGRAEAFFRSALFNRQERQWKLAAFLLHQAAETAYQAVLLTFTGYKPCTHNLDKLRRYTQRLSLALGMVFPRDSLQEDHLFRLLLDGYVDARYKEGYAITEQELAILTERVSVLLTVSARICRNRFVRLGRMAATG